MQQLIHGDCLEEMKGIASGSIDMILCDLPYGVTQCSWDTVIPFEDLWDSFNRVAKPSTPIVLFGSEPFSSKLRISNLKDFKYDLVWDKVSTTGFLNANRMPLRQHEYIHVFYKKQCTYNPQKVEGKPRTKGGRKTGTTVYGASGELPKESYNMYHPTSIIVESNANQKDKIHPTQKPVALFEYLIKTYTNEGETVLDSCAGSFTTAIACLNTNRNSICIEKDEMYFNLGSERVRKHELSLTQVNEIV